MKRQKGIFIFYGIFYGFIMSIAFALMLLLLPSYDIDPARGVITGVVGGVVSGVLFAVLMSIISGIKSKSFQHVRNELSKEHTLHCDSPASYFGKRIIGVDGQLVLTDREIIFMPGGFNIKKPELTMPLNNVVKADVYGIMPNRMAVMTKDGKRERFVVTYGRAVFVQKINQAIADIGGSNV